MPADPTEIRPADGFATLDSPDVLVVLFHPRRSAPARSTDSLRSVRIPLAEAVTLSARLHVAAPDAPLILFFHGNGEVATDYDGIGQFYTAMGINLLVVDFRGYGAGSGSPTSSALVADAAAVWKRLPEVLAAQKLRPKRLFVMGRSLGSASAIEIACRAGDGLAGLIIESGFAHTFPLVARLGGPPLGDADEAKHGFGALAKIARVTAPTLILHGEVDRIIPTADAQALYRRAAAKDKRLVLIAAAGHNDLLLVARQRYFQAIRTFVFE